MESSTSCATASVFGSSVLGAQSQGHAALLVRRRPSSGTSRTGIAIVEFRPCALLRNRERSVEIRPFIIADEEAVIDLWRRCGLLRPWNDPKKDIRRKLKVRPDLFLVGQIDGHVVATAMVGYDGHRGWINYLAVCPDQQRHGLGRQIMDAAEQRLRECGAPKINLQVRTGNREVIQFYRSLGFEMDDVVSMGKRLERD